MVSEGSFQFRHFWKIENPPGFSKQRWGHRTFHLTLSCKIIKQENPFGRWVGGWQVGGSFRKYYQFVAPSCKLELDFQLCWESEMEPSVAIVIDYRSPSGPGNLNTNVNAHSSSERNCKICGFKLQTYGAFNSHLLFLLMVDGCWKHYELIIQNHKSCSSSRISLRF